MKDLSEHSDVSPQAINEIELEKTSPRGRTLDKIRIALEGAGVKFTATGIEQSESTTIISGPDWYTQLLNDVAHSRARELIVEFADDRVSSPEVTEALRDMRAAGFRFFMTASADNTHLAGRVEEYRLVPADKFINVVTLIYGDKVAIGRGDRTSCLVVRDADLAKAMRAKFQLLWPTLATPQSSTAGNDERF